jgi:hypothetical protein
MVSDCQLERDPGVACSRLVRLPALRWHPAPQPSLVLNKPVGLVEVNHRDKPCQRERTGKGNRWRDAFAIPPSKQRCGSRGGKQTGKKIGLEAGMPRVVTGGICQQRDKRYPAQKGRYPKKLVHVVERPGSGTPGQWYPNVNRDAIPALPAAGLLDFESIMLPHPAPNASGETQ